MKELTPRERKRVGKMLMKQLGSYSLAVERYRDWEDRYGKQLIAKAYHYSGLPLTRWNDYFKEKIKT